MSKKVIMLLGKDFETGTNEFYKYPMKYYDGNDTLLNIFKTNHPHINIVKERFD